MNLIDILNLGNNDELIFDRLIRKGKKNGILGGGGAENDEKPPCLFEINIIILRAFKIVLREWLIKWVVLVSFVLIVVMYCLTFGFDDSCIIKINKKSQCTDCGQTANTIKNYKPASINTSNCHKKKPF